MNDPVPDPLSPETHLDIGLELADHRWTDTWPDYEADCLKAVRLVLYDLEANPAGCNADHPIELTITLTNNTGIQQLNRDYRSKDEPTNVLSFALEDSPDSFTPPSGMPRILGDIILALETVEDEAKRQKKSFCNHACHLVVHGVLHLLGHNHDADDEACHMENLERWILTKLGQADPYAETVKPARPNTGVKSD